MRARGTLGLVNVGGGRLRVLGVGLCMEVAGSEES